jgi:hypothetical protein
LFEKEKFCLHAARKTSPTVQVRQAWPMRGRHFWPPIPSSSPAADPGVSFPVISRQRFTFVFHFFAPVEALQGFGVTATAAKGRQTGVPLRQLGALMQVCGVAQVGTRAGQNRPLPLPGRVDRSFYPKTQACFEQVFVKSQFGEKRQVQAGNVTRFCRAYFSRRSAIFALLVAVTYPFARATES